MIFVFGSNLAGRHGAGAAKFAHKYRFAEYGIGEGPTGNAYAIPTKDEKLKTRSLEDIRMSVDKFIKYAKSHDHLDFEVTKIGCGLAGYTEDDIRPMFFAAPGNCELPEGWRLKLEDLFK